MSRLFIVDKTISGRVYLLHKYNQGGVGNGSPCLPAGRKAGKESRWVD